MDYSSTLNLPKTDFPMRAELPKKEPELLRRWEETGLYKKIMAASGGRPGYTLHDGPPYANGNIHMGHALNKILKDMIVKSRFMMGNSTDYIPGWDCHGLPIELQVEKELKGAERAALSKVEIRRECRRYAEKYVNIQREEFKRLGVFGEWEDPYLTMSYSYQADILRELGKFFGSGLVYRGKKPVHWCPSCRTALAEAEVEYAEKTSPSIYVKFRVANPMGLKGFAKDAYFVIWTTTAWTLPANLAIAVHPRELYSHVKTPQGELIILQSLVKPCLEKFGLKNGDYEITGAARAGAELEGIVCEHPFIKRETKIALAEFVVTDTGTGCVHIAPGHGQDDYELGMRCGLDIYAPVDDAGRFTEDVAEFSGQKVFDANKAIVELLKEKKALLFSETIAHSYPHCWRCKNPVIFRATEQWFVSMEKGDLRKRSLEAIDAVEWVPSWGKDRMRNMVAGRPDWCISRQRAWGVPIPALGCKNCGKSFLDGKLIEDLAVVFEKEGADVWFERPVEEFAAGVKCPFCGQSDFTKEEDILDVWFDSGVSFSAVVEKRKNLEFPADLYLEGSDQHRGWFQSSLFCSVATRGTAPYRAVLTHGFVVDGVGRKMSKSLGNVLSPQEVIGKYGAEVLRLWVAAEDYGADIRISKEILERLAESYRRIRNTFRFMLGNLYDFDPRRDSVGYGDLREVDKLTLHRLGLLTERVLGAYERFEFHTVYHSVHNFCAVELSAFYLDILKDRLYTQKASSPQRRSAQTVIYTALNHLLRLLSPILAFTTDEAWALLPGENPESVHLSEFPKVEKEWVDAEAGRKWLRLLEIRTEAAWHLEMKRKEKLIGHSLDAKVAVELPGGKDDEERRYLERILKEILIVSDVAVSFRETGESFFSVPFGGAPWVSVRVERASGSKCARCWHITPEVGSNAANPEICGRCVEALK